MAAERFPAAGRQKDDANFELVEEAIAGYLDQLNSGQSLDPKAVLAENPGVGHEILEILERFIGLNSSEVGDEPSVGTLGEYRLVRKLGRGGMGVVYEAWQGSMNRRVALKVLPAAVAAGSKACARFLREAQAAGKLSHPNIVPVHALGVAENTLYYAMEYVEGETLAQILARMSASGERQPLAAASATTRSQSFLEADETTARYYLTVAEAFAGVAEGLQHAHSKGVIHRDIKPSNLILDGSGDQKHSSDAGRDQGGSGHILRDGRPDPEADQGGRPLNGGDPPKAHERAEANGRLRILDFGLAQLEGQESLTETGEFVGTPHYVSPEQANTPNGRVLNHRTDIYSLGTTLYEALTRCTPFRGKSREETLRQIIAGDPAPPRKLNSRIPRDLETIVLKCLRKDPADRYASADLLAQDLRRFVRGEPIAARPQAAWEKLGRRLWRNRLRIAVLAVVLAILAMVLRHVTLRPEGIVNRFVWNLPASTRLTGRISPDGRYIPVSNRPIAAVRDLVTKTTHVLPQNNRGWAYGLSAIAPDGQRVAYNWFWRDENHDLHGEFRIVDRDGANIKVLYRYSEWRCWVPYDWSPDGTKILAGRSTPNDRQTAQLVLLSVDGDSTTVLKSWPASVSLGLGHIVSFSPDGRYVAFNFTQERKSPNHDIFVIGLDDLRETAIMTHPADDRLIGWAPDSRRILFSSTRTASLSLWTVEVQGGEPRGSPVLIKKAFEGDPLGLTRDGSLYYSVRTGRIDVYVLELDPVTGNSVGQPKIASSRFVGSNSVGEWSPDGKSLVFKAKRADGEEVISIYSLDSGDERILEPSPGFVARKNLHDPRWSPDGRALLVNARGLKSGRGLYIVDPETGANRRITKRHDDVHSWRRFFGPAWSPDGDSVYVTRAGAYWVIVKIAVASGEEKEIYRGTVSGRLDVSPDGRWLAFYRRRDSIVLLPPEGGEPEELLRLGEGEKNFRFRFVRWTPDGNYLLFAKRDNELWRIDVESREQKQLLRAPGALKSASLHRDGRLMAFTSEGRYGELWVMKNLPGL